MSETPENPPAEGSEETESVELPAPQSQPPEEVEARAEVDVPDLDERERNIRRHRRPAGPPLAEPESDVEAQESAPPTDDVPATEPADESQE
jgi:hypothetical protein